MEDQTMEKRKERKIPSLCMACRWGNWVFSPWQRGEKDEEIRIKVARRRNEFELIQTMINGFCFWKLSWISVWSRGQYIENVLAKGRGPWCRSIPLFGVILEKWVVGTTAKTGTISTTLQEWIFVVALSKYAKNSHRIILYFIVKLHNVVCP